MIYGKLREPRYSKIRLKLEGKQPKVLNLSFPSDFIAFTDISEIDPTKVYVAFNEPSTFLQISKAVVAELPEPVVYRLLFKWNTSEEGKTIELYYAGAPGLKIGVTTVGIGADYIGLAKENTLQELLSVSGPKISSVSNIVTSYSLSASSNYDFTVQSQYGWSAVIVSVRATYDASATSGVRVIWMHSPDGINYDDEDNAINAGNYEDLYFSAGATVQRTIIIPLASPYILVRVKNLDASYPVTITVWKWYMR